MKSIKEFIISFFESAKDRLKNPVVGAFIMAWVAINWRFIAILLFSSKSIEQKIDFIEEKYFDINLNLWIPLGFAVFYVLILPYIMALFDWLSQKGISARKLILKNQRISDIQHRQEIAAEEWQLDKIRQGSPDISALKERIVELEASSKEKDEVISTLSENINIEESKSNNSENNKAETATKRKPRKKTNSTSTTTSTNNESNKSSEKSKQSNNYPIMKDIVIRDLAKTEREWILIYALYTSDFGKNVLTRDDIWIKYEESNRVTHSRKTNLTNNIKNMIKSGQLKYINDDEMLLTESGVQTATEILNR
jgi:DNA primase